MAYFQELIPHWSLTFHSNGLQHHGGLGLSFPKWYDTCIFVEKWLHNSPKSEELRFWSKFWQNFRGLFGAFKTLFWCNQRYIWMPPYGYSRFLTSKTNFENLILQIPYYDPMSSLRYQTIGCNTFPSSVKAHSTDHLSTKEMSSSRLPSIFSCPSPSSACWIWHDMVSWKLSFFFWN